MKKIRKHLKAITDLPIILMTVGVVVLIGGYLFADKLTEDYYKYAIIAIAVFLHVVSALMLINRSKRLNKRVAHETSVISNELKQITENKLRRSYATLGINEMGSLQEGVNNVIKFLTRKAFFEPDTSAKQIPNVIDEKTGLLNIINFDEKVQAALSKRQLYRSAVICIKLSEESNPKILAKLVAQLNKTFNCRYIGAGPEDLIYVFIEEVASVTILKMECYRIITDFNEIDVIPATNLTKMYSLKIGGAVYPYSSAETIVEDACLAIKNCEKELNIILKPLSDFNFHHHKLASQDEIERASLIVVEDMQAKLARCKTNLDIKEHIRNNLKDLAKIIDTTVAGYLLFDVGHEYLECRYEVNSNAEGLGGFKKIEYLDREFVAEYLELFESDGSLFAHDIKDLPSTIRKKFENLGIKSFYHCKIVKNGEVEGIIYFNAVRHMFKLTLSERAVLLSFTALLAQNLSSLVANINEERQALLLNTLLKRDDKYIYLIDRDTHKFTYLSKNLQEKYPHLRVGMVCFKGFNSEANNPCVNCPLTAGEGPIVRAPLGKDLKISTINYLTSGRIEAAVLIEKPTEARREVGINELDPILHIPNALALQHHFAEELFGKSLGYVGMVQVDNFSGQAKTFGKEVLEQALDILSKRIQSLGYEDCIYRRDDATFALLLKQYKRPQALDTMEKIYAIIAKPIMIEGKEHTFNFHSSLITYPSDIPSKDSLMKLTETTLKEASALGINQLYIFGEKGARISDRKAYILDFVKTAIHKEKFEVYVQPIYDKTGKNVVSAEALLRLEDPSRGFIPPNEFVPIAAENGLMFEIEQANISRVGELWKLYGFTIFKQSGLKQITINISTDSLYHVDFVSRVKAQCRKYRFPRGFLQFEIRESILKDNMDIVKNTIAQLSDQNISWSIDNYGMYETEMSILRAMNVDAIKLDRTFILDFESNARGKVTVSYMLDIAKKHGLKVCAEGLERQEQLVAVQAMSFDFLQGYLLAKPMPVNDFIRLLNFGR